MKATQQNFVARATNKMLSPGPSQAVCILPEMPCRVEQGRKCGNQHFKYCPYQ